MTTEAKIDMRKIIDDSCAAWNAHDVEKMVSFFTEDGRYDQVHEGRVVEGREALKEEFTQVFSAMPDFKLEWPTIFMGQNMTAFEWIMTGTQQGDYQKIPATGRGFNVRGATIIEMRGDKIARQTNYVDGLSFLQQLGVLPEQLMGQE